MHSMTWTLTIALLIGVTAVDAADVRVSADDSWCRDDRGSDRGDRRIQYCEVREADLAPEGTLQVDSRPNGGIEVRGWDRSSYRLRVRVTAAAESLEEARAIASQVRVETAGVVRVTGPERSSDRQWSASFRLDVPRDADVDLQADNGGLHLAGVTGNTKLNTRNGGLHLEGVGGRVTGTTTNGGLHVVLSGTEWQGDGLDISSTNGGVHLQIPDGYNARLETGTVNGGVHGDLGFTTERRRGRSGGRIETDLGRGGALLRLTTTNGGLHIQSN